HPLTVDLRAVARAEVTDRPPRAHAFEHAMKARHGGVIGDDDVVGLVLADRQALAVEGQKLRARRTPELDPSRLRGPRRIRASDGTPYMGTPITQGGPDPLDPGAGVPEGG